MKLTHTRKCILLFIIGFLLIAVDIKIGTGIDYPITYDNSSDEITGEYQYYNIKSTYGATCTYKMYEDESGLEASDGQGIEVIDEVFFSDIQIDLLNDFVGFSLIMIAAWLLRKTNSSFKLSFIGAMASFVLHGIICLLPCIVNGFALCNFVMILDIAYIACGIFTTYMFTNGLMKSANDICCRDERIWIKTDLFVIIILQVLKAFVYWLGSDYKPLITMGNVFAFVIIVLLIAYFIFVRRIEDYVQKSYDEALEK